MDLKIKLLLCCLFTLLFSQNNFAQQTNYDVLFHTGTAELPENFKSNQDQLSFSTEEVFDGYYNRLVQFYANPNQAERQVMENMGLHFLDYVPHFTYIIAVPEDFDWNQIASDKIRSVTAINPLLKLDSRLAMEQGSGEHIELILAYPDFYTIDQIEEACIENGITVIESSRYNAIMKVSMPANLIFEKAALPFISFIEKDPGKPVLDDVRGRALHRSNLVDSEYPSGYHFNGEGVNINVRDDGAIGPHIDFQGRVDNSYQNIPNGSHETRVAGTLGGAGNIDPYAKGMADGAFMFGTDYQSSFLDETMDLHFNEGVVITNSSYSDGCNDGYMSNTATVDQQIYQNPSLIHIFSAGNSNDLDCGYGAGTQWGNITGGHKVGKNVIATANIYYDGTIVPSSSRGPAEDGRIKPDISAQGAVYAQLPNNEYTTTSGTSFSSPSVAGVLAQLYQAYKTWNGGNNPPSALLKACLLNTANDLGNVGPDFKFGWGHLNAYRALKTVEEVRYFSDEVEEGIENQHNLIVAPDVTQLKVMVYWSDRQGSPFGAKALVNNLDIQIVTSTGNVLLPYVLDPTPNATTLNYPATNGVDDLNNMEQIVIDNPVIGAGNYTLLVNGTEVPFGPQEYFVVWEEVTDDLMVTWPNGGECLTTTLDHTIHWDARPGAGDFLLEYSPDAGASWTTIATVSGSLRNYDWNPPADYTGLAMVRVTRDGNTDTSDATFSLMNAPQNVEVLSACPDYLTISWDSVPGATGYIVYTLGPQYMDSVAMTLTNSADIPVAGLGVDVWYAVSCIGADDACSPRTIAQLYNESLLNCTLNNDVALNQSSAFPATNCICAPWEEVVTVSVFNNGMSAQTDMTISYSHNDGPVVTETYPGPLMPGETFDYTFTTLYNPNNGNNKIKAWVYAAVDDFVPNDTLDMSFDLIMNTNAPAAMGYSQDFESGTFPPVGWELNNPDGGITWVPSNVVGSSGSFTTAMFMNFFNFSTDAEKDELITMPIDLTGTTNPIVTFDVAYARASSFVSDSLLVRVSTLCPAECVSDIVYFKYGDDLATHPSQFNGWTPNSADDWRNEAVDLSAYAGNQIFLTFTGIGGSGSGNSLFFDNINIEEGVVTVAGFEVSQSPNCVFEQMEFSNNSTGPVDSYQWIFGSGSFPSAADTEGPHSILYTSVGQKTITLAVTGVLGDDLYTSTVDIVDQTIPSFTYTENDNAITFTNTSTYGSTYVWNFGDGNSSTDENPVHYYSAVGDYTVTLSVTNACGSATFVTTVSVTMVSASDLENDFEIALSPNPGTNEVIVTVGESSTRMNQIELYNASGQLVKSIPIESTNTDGKYQVMTNDLPVGTYWFKLIFESGTKSRRWVKM